MRTQTSRLHALSTLLLLAPAAVGQAADEVFVDLPLPSALARAEKNEQVVILYFHEGENPGSRRMLAETYGDGKVREWLTKNAVTLQVPMTDLKTCARFSVENTPYTVILRSDARVLHRMDGFKDVNEFLIEAEIALLGLGEAKQPSGDSANNPIAWLAWANWLFANSPESSRDCAAAYFWCLDRGDETMPGFRERHFEFLLERLSYLKARTADAIDGLFIRRQDLRDKITAGIGTPVEAYEYCRYNYWLRDQYLTVELFKALGEHDTEEHKACRLVLFEQELKRIVDYRWYDDVLSLVPDPLAQVDQRLRAYQKEVEGGQVSTATRSKIIDDSASFYECLLHAGRGADAMELVNRVVSKVPTGRTYFAFLERAQRLEFHDLARKLADMGLEKVETPKGKRMLERAKARIPASSELGKGTTPIPTKGDKGDEDR